MVEAIAWTLIHFIGQAAIVAAALAAVAAASRSATATTRYTACLGALLVMAAAPLVTLATLLSRATPTPLANAHVFPTPSAPCGGGEWPCYTRGCDVS